MAPVHVAAQCNDVVELERLLDADARLLEEEEEVAFYWLQSKDRPLHKACAAGSLEVVRLLVERGANLSARNYEGKTPFVLACQWGRAEVVSYLLSRETDPTCSENLGPGLVLASYGHDRARGSDQVAVIQLLLKDERLKGRTGFSMGHGSDALRAACAGGDLVKARLLLLEGRVGTRKAALWLRSGEVPVYKAQTECLRLLEWYDGNLEKPSLLIKARAVVDDTESITKAPEKVGAKTEAGAQKAREAAAPAYLKGRVEKGEALPVLRMLGLPRKRSVPVPAKEERGAVCEFVVRELNEQLYIELMEGLQL